MGAGWSDRFNILETSPHDALGCGSQPVEPLRAEEFTWIASRYNIRATTEDGRLVLWNTLKGSMIVLRGDQAEAVKTLLTRRGFEAPKEGIVEYLADQGFLVKKEANEYRQFQRLFGEQHYQNNLLELILLPSEDCNFRCTYCYEDFARGTMEPWVRQGVRKMVEQRIHQGLRHLEVRWFGGEPLYGMAALEDLAPFFVEACAENGLTYRSQMTTNGYLLTPDMASRLFEWEIRRFQVTIDGPPEYHDKSRPTRDGGETFATIFENLKALRDRDESFHVDLRVNFDRKNAPELGRFFDMAAEEFSGDWRFRMHLKAVGRWGGPNDAQLDVCTDDAGAVAAYLAHEAERRGIDVRGNLRDANRFGSEVCYAARPYNLIIGATGKLMKCTIVLDSEDFNVVGQLNADGSLEFDDDRFALWTEPAFEDDKKCQKCVVAPLCQGIHCPLIRMEENRSPCTPLRDGIKQSLAASVTRPGGGESRHVVVAGGR